jgi:hypothetical protein
MIPMLLMVLVSEVLHLWLGWPLWAGVVIVCALTVGRSFLWLLGYGAALKENRMRLALEVVGGTAIIALLAYISMIIVNFLMMHPSW